MGVQGPNHEWISVYARSQRLTGLRWVGRVRLVVSSPQWCLQERASDVVRRSAAASGSRFTHGS
eukprot:6400111-Alexandrium_andersonii.AAC.1